ncbi:hypothetical protein BOVATA_048830 [Babesia ovata]|uniref:Uncharacterized protein n=1 Tax=Babesia ovata TaxID=189622 RepID=A0A2H6KK79_9APIC|nr:uncharacterized protein BOVATA_048830 [Babesia ovata]GBE63390.1 hypothetical protein BOVATA_048830 [Babesia ovata]
MLRFTVLSFFALIVIETYVAPPFVAEDVLESIKQTFEVLLKYPWEICNPRQIQTSIFVGKVFVRIGAKRRQIGSAVGVLAVARTRRCETSDMRIITFVMAFYAMPISVGESLYKLCRRIIKCNGVVLNCGFNYSFETLYAIPRSISPLANKRQSETKVLWKGNWWFGRQAKEG